MSDQFIAPDAPPAKAEPKGRYQNKAGKPQAGRVTGLIGEGIHAQNSIVFVTIAAAFAAATLFTIISFIIYAWKEACAATSFGDVVKGVWSVFIPVITLALGYAFGKGRS